MKRRRFHVKPPAKKPKSDMFSTLSGKVKKGEGKHISERRRYLQLLVSEFYEDDCSPSAKEQIMSNLANFAYDPYNYQFFEELKIIEMFMEHVNSGVSDNLTKFALAGICNSSSDYKLGQDMFEKGILHVCLAKLVPTTGVETGNLINMIYCCHILINLRLTGLLKTDVWKDSILPAVQLLHGSIDARLNNVIQIMLNLDE